jgi:hypothetical protein
MTFEYVWEFRSRPSNQERIGSILWLVLARMHRHNQPIFSTGNAFSNQPIHTIHTIHTHIETIVPILSITHCIAAAVTWMSIVFIPMAKANRVGITMLCYQPLSLRVDTRYPDAGANVVIITYQASNTYYFKYTAFGVNIVMLSMYCTPTPTPPTTEHCVADLPGLLAIDLFPFVVLTLFLAYIPKILRTEALLPPTAMFVLCAISTVPLSHYIGMSLARYHTILQHPLRPNDC